LERAVKTGHAAPNDSLLLAQLDSRNGKHTEAIKILITAVRADPYVSDLTDAMAAEYLKLGDYGKGLEVIRRGLSLFPDDRVLRALMSEVQAASIEEPNGSHVR
jgi:tetratricopeptide (TPR) repeat protein